MNDDANGKEQAGSSLNAEDSWSWTQLQQSQSSRGDDAARFKDWQAAAQSHSHGTEGNAFNLKMFCIVKLYQKH